MLVKIKILKDADEAQSTATAVCDCEFTDAWLNLDSVSIVLPHKTMNMLSVWFEGDYHIIVTHEEWERVAKLHGFWEWTDEEVAQIKEDAEDCKRLIQFASQKDELTENDRLYMNKDRADIDCVCSVSARGLETAYRMAKEWLESKGYDIAEDGATWFEFGLNQWFKFRDARGLFAFAKEKGWILPVDVDSSLEAK